MMTEQYQGLVSHAGKMEWAEHSHSELGKGQVKIKIAAAGLNRADLSQIAGTYLPPEGTTEVLGLECSGTIIEVGEDVVSWKSGDQVCALLAGGGMATEVVCDQRQLLPVPKGLSVIEAAGVVEVFATAWLNLFLLAEVQKGEKALVMAGASGVGLAAIQLCREFGVEVAVVVGSDEKLSVCKKLGASGGINRHSESWDALKAFGPFNVVLDCCGGDWLEKQMSLMAEGGRLVNIGLLAGRKAQIDVGCLLMKRLNIMGSTLRFLPVERKQEILTDLQQKVWPLMGAGNLKMVLDSQYGIADFDAAYERLKSNQTTGKVIMTLPE